MPKRMPAAVERALIEMLGWRDRPNPVDLYAAVYETLAVETKPYSAGSDEPTPAEFLDRARRFERAAWHNIDTGQRYTMPAVLHLAAHALELTLKAVLLREGWTAAELKRAPYGHDIAYMWQLDEVAFLRAIAPGVARAVVENARRSARWQREPILGTDPGKLFAEQLSMLTKLHSAETDFVLRYPSGNPIVPNPPFLVEVIRDLINAVETLPPPEAEPREEKPISGEG